MFEIGHFPNLLQDVLHALGTYVRPVYETREVYEPPRACYYITRIHDRVMDAGYRGFRTLSAHESLTPLSTYAASVSDAARRTLWSLIHTYRQQLHNTKYMHLPLCIRGENQTSIVPGGANEDRLNTLTGVVVGLNTDLDSAILDLSRVHFELEDAHARITALEAQLDGRNPPEVQVSAMALSPPRKRIRCCDTPGVNFTLCREICPNLGRSVKFSISRSRLSPFIKLLVKVSPISDFIRISRTAKFGACGNFSFSARMRTR